MSFKDLIAINADIKKQRLALSAKVKEEGKEALVEYLKQFFIDNPEISDIKWNQYTPGFNDGDPCVFSVNSVYVLTKDKLLGGEGEEDGWKSHYSFRSYDEDSHKLVSISPTCDRIEKSIEALEEVFQANEEILEALFGDGNEIFISHQLTVTVEECYHD